MSRLRLVTSFVFNCLLYTIVIVTSSPIPSAIKGPRHRDSSLVCEWIVHSVLHREFVLC